MKRLLSLFVVLVLMGAGCNSNKISSTQTYSNSFLQITMELPAGWYVSNNADDEYRPNFYSHKECVNTDRTPCTRIEFSEAVKLVTGGAKTFEDGLKRDKTTYTILGIIPNATVFKIVSEKNTDGYTNQYYIFFPQEERVFLASGVSDEGDKKIEDVLATLKILQGENSNISQVPNNETSTHIDTTNWKTYTNKQYGLSFKYPAEWGPVSMLEGNRKLEGELLCGAGSHIAVYGAPDQVYIHDIQLIFSNPPVKTAVAGFKVLTYDPQRSGLNLCEETNKAINLEEDRMLFLELPYMVTTDGLVKSTFTNLAGVKVLYYPNWLSGAGSTVDQFYKMYGNGIEVEGGFHYGLYAGTPEGDEAEEYYKMCDASRDCVGELKWAKEGKTSATLRNAFAMFDQVVRTFMWIK